MRIMHTADWHLGKNIEGHSRMDEQSSFLADFVKITAEQNIDLVIIAGDIYDSYNPPARAEELFYETLKQLSDGGKRLILVIAGNHDNPQRLEAPGPLARDHGILMAGVPKTIIPTGAYGHHRVVESGEGYVEIEINGERAVILLLPYPSEKRLNEVLYDLTTDEEQNQKSYSDRIHAYFLELESHFRADTINLVTTHIFAMGSEESGSERSIQLGGTYIVDGNCFPQKAHYIALGHIHKPQVIPGTDGRGRYAGSPIHFNRREIAYQKKCIVVEIVVEAGKTVKNEVSEMPLQVYKPIEVWRCANVDEAIAKCEENAERSCWVYLEIETDHYIREDEIKKMKVYKDDILEVIPKLTVLETEASLESLTEKSFGEVFKEFYRRERGTEADDEVMELLLSLVLKEEK
ncbi:exonuclease SbcCD subunit D [Acetobacterium woodii]|uniref:Nuclease SbcCD subunit D n=1 Tax=Acetobacterium woodii (strain ATCC 29683 / DSM 1030 / JCM 2381 / KCTC 1655 / WB1) TaxID=931626 RepID=H6LCL4_ACEWD|nr:exonuclease SbcCD subunit D [Acetobacterium woodii]AFA47796.1 DNA repair exonuclease subunit D [Acetobacterium woodii DSM 1030]